MENKDIKKLKKHLKREAESAMYVLPVNHPEEEPKILPAKHIHSSVFEEAEHGFSSDKSSAKYDHRRPTVYFSWIAPEYLQHPKSVSWWVWAGITLFISAILEFITGNYTMLIATVTFAAVYTYLHEHHPPKHTRISISEIGIKIGHRMIPYSEIELFWIFYQSPRVKTLNLRLTTGLFCDIAIELANQDPLAIQEKLLEHIPQWEGKKEHFSDVILRLIKL